MNAGGLIRPLAAADRAAWAQLRAELWPDCPAERHALEITEFLQAGSRAACFVAEDSETGLLGFAEFSVRSQVDGTETSPVAFLEGWFVRANARGRRLGAALLTAGENWARSLGLTELASDAELWNEDAIRAHAALGFRETFRVVQFVKRIAVPNADKV